MASIAFFSSAQFLDPIVSVPVNSASSNSHANPVRPAPSSAEPARTYVWKETAGESCRSTTTNCSPFGSVNSLVRFSNSFTSCAVASNATHAMAPHTLIALTIAILPHPRITSPLPAENRDSTAPRFPSAILPLDSPPRTSSNTVEPRVLTKYRCDFSRIPPIHIMELRATYHGLGATFGGGRHNIRRPEARPALPIAVGAEMEAHPPPPGSRRRYRVYSGPLERRNHVRRRPHFA